MPNESGNTTTEPNAEALPVVVRTSAGLRDALFDELDRMRTGRTNATNANAIARLAGSIVETVQMELEVHKQMSRIPGENSARMQLPRPLDLSRQNDQNNG